MLNRSQPLAYRLLCLLMAGLTACATSRPQNVWTDVGPQPTTGLAKSAEIVDAWGAKPEAPDVPDPVIAPGFLLNIQCPADDKITGDYRVGFNGEVQLPYSITVMTTGETLSHFKKKLIDRFHSYFKNPTEIEVRVKERQYWVDVRGLVEKPGRFLVEPESSLDMVIGMAGGTYKPTPPLYVRIQKGQKAFILDLNQYYSQGEDHPQILGWLGGEVLFFQKESASSSLGLGSPANVLPIYIMGEVKKPGDYTLFPGADFVDTLVQAGGFTGQADLDDIEVIRRTGGRKRAYEFSWKEFQHAPALQQGDVVFVHADTSTKNERRTLITATVIGAIATVLTSTVLVLDYHQRYK